MLLHCMKGIPATAWGVKGGALYCALDAKSMLQDDCLVQKNDKCFVRRKCGEKFEDVPPRQWQRTKASLDVGLLKIQENPEEDGSLFSLQYAHAHFFLSCFAHEQTFTLSGISAGIPSDMCIPAGIPRNRLSCGAFKSKWNTSCVGSFAISWYFPAFWTLLMLYVHRTLPQCFWFRTRCFSDRWLSISRCAPHTLKNEHVSIAGFHDQPPIVPGCSGIRKVSKARFAPGQGFFLFKFKPG